MPRHRLCFHADALRQAFALSGMADDAGRLLSELNTSRDHTGRQSAVLLHGLRPTKE